MWTPGQEWRMGRICSFQISTASLTEMLAWVVMQGSLKHLHRNQY